MLMRDVWVTVTILSEDEHSQALSRGTPSIRRICSGKEGHEEIAVQISVQISVQIVLPYYESNLLCPGVWRIPPETQGTAAQRRLGAVTAHLSG